MPDRKFMVFEPLPDLRGYLIVVTHGLVSCRHIDHVVVELRELAKFLCGIGHRVSVFRLSSGQRHCRSPSCRVFHEGRHLHCHYRTTTLPDSQICTGFGHDNSRSSPDAHSEGDCPFGHRTVRQEGSPVATGHRGCDDLPCDEKLNWFSSQASFCQEALRCERCLDGGRLVGRGKAVVNRQGSWNLLGRKKDCRRSPEKEGREETGFAEGNIHRPLRRIRQEEGIT